MNQQQQQHPINNNNQHHGLSLFMGLTPAAAKLAHDHAVSKRFSPY
jgi:hypothetical protein